MGNVNPSGISKATDSRVGQDKLLINMSFRRVQGRTKLMWLPVTASTALSANSLVAFDSGKLIAATSATAPTSIIGVLRHAITSSDSDYADERLVEVEVPTENNVVWEADVTSGLVAADIGLFKNITSATHVDKDASSYDVVQCVKVLSTTKGLFILNVGTSGMGIIGG